MRKTNRTNIRNIQKSGGTYYVTIPVNIIRKLDWQERHKVVVNLKPGKRIEIKDWR